MNSGRASLKILMFPWLAHGHIFPYLELAKRILSRKNFHIYCCSTEINFSSIKNFIEKDHLLQNSVELVQIHLKPCQELPPHYHTTKNLPSKLLLTLLKAFQTSSSSFSDIITTLKPDLLIYDIYQPWAAKLALSQGIPAVHFAAFGAATLSVVHHHFTSKESIDDDFPFQELCLPDQDMKSMDNLLEFLSANVFCEDKDNYLVNHKLSCDIVLVKTSKGFEGRYIDYYSTVCQKKLIPVGPLVSINKYNEEEKNSLEIIEWLSKKNQHSTVYISFGSEYFLSKDEMEEIAKGLELCDVNFMWVIRFPIGETISVQEALPQGFLERVKGRGMIVEKWAPQSRILGHSSIGGFVCHCGWSSVTESVYFGVPIIAMPKKLNMLIDARMVAENGVGVEISRDENMSYKGQNIANAIKVVMEDKSGEGLRHKARETSEKMKMEEDQELDEAAEQLWKLCLKNKKQD